MYQLSVKHCFVSIEHKNNGSRIIFGSIEGISRGQFKST